VKLIVLYKKGLIGKQRLFPRDIRNYIGSISSEADKEYTMWHKRKVPHLVYMMPMSYLLKFENHNFSSKKPYFWCYCTIYEIKNIHILNLIYEIKLDKHSIKYENISVYYTIV
jgi:hypothetical protein